MKYLLGATKNHEIVFAEFGVRRYGDGRRSFSASFEMVSPLNGNKFDVNSYISDQFEGMSAADKYTCASGSIARRARLCRSGRAVTMICGTFWIAACTRNGSALTAKIGILSPALAGSAIRGGTAWKDMSIRKRSTI